LVRRGTGSQAEPIIGHQGHSVVMHKGSQDNQDVKNLVTLELQKKRELRKKSIFSQIFFSKNQNFFKKKILTKKKSDFFQKQEKKIRIFSKKKFDQRIPSADFFAIKRKSDLDK
jgi:hypothetical protein